MEERTPGGREDARTGGRSFSRNACWDTLLPEVRTSLLRCILGEVGGASTHPGYLSVLAEMRTLNWNSTWSGADDVSQERKNASTDKYAY